MIEGESCGGLQVQELNIDMEPGDVVDDILGATLFLTVPLQTLMPPL